MRAKVLMWVVTLTTLPYPLFFISGIAAAQQRHAPMMLASSVARTRSLSALLASCCRSMATAAFVDENVQPSVGVRGIDHLANDASRIGHLELMRRNGQSPFAE